MDGSDVDDRVGCAERWKKLTGRNCFLCLADAECLRARVKAQVGLLIVADCALAAGRRVAPSENIRLGWMRHSGRDDDEKAKREHRGLIDSLESSS